MSKLILDDAGTALREAGAKAKRKGEPAAACPYKMREAVGRIHLQAILEARGLWFEGYNGQPSHPVKRFAHKRTAPCQPKP